MRRTLPLLASTCWSDPYEIRLVPAAARLVLGIVPAVTSNAGSERAKQNDLRT
jgi:hypothetical protein